MNDEEKDPSPFETHAQTVVGAVILAILLGSGGLLLAMRDDVQGLQKDVQHLSDQLRSGIDDRFRGSDWRREERALNERFERAERRLDRLETQGEHKRLAK